VGSRAGLDAAVKGKIPNPRRESILRIPVVLNRKRSDEFLVFTSIFVMWVTQIFVLYKFNYIPFGFYAEKILQFTDAESSCHCCPTLIMK